MSRLTKQQYYDLLVTTSKNGGFPAADDHGNCFYRTEDGKRCVVGIVLPDNLYQRCMEGKAFSRVCEILIGEYESDHQHLPDDVRKQDPTKFEWVPEHMSLCDLASCQSAHDNLVLGHGQWVHSYFVKNLNALSCFQDVQKVTE